MNVNFDIRNFFCICNEQGKKDHWKNEFDLNFEKRDSVF